MEIKDDNLIVKCRGTPVTIFARHIPYIDLCQSFKLVDGAVDIDYDPADLHGVLDALRENQTFLFPNQWPDKFQSIVRYLGVNVSYYSKSLKQLEDNVWKIIEVERFKHKSIVFNTLQYALIAREKIPSDLEQFLIERSPCLWVRDFKTFEIRVTKVYQSNEKKIIVYMFIHKC